MAGGGAPTVGILSLVEKYNVVTGTFRTKLIDLYSVCSRERVDGDILPILANYRKPGHSRTGGGELEKK